MKIDFRYLKTHLAEHPISYRYAVLYPFIAAACGTAILSLMILNKVYPKFAQTIISENLAPLTFEVLCYIGLLYLTQRVIRKGLIKDLKKEDEKFLCFYIPAGAIGIKATYSGIVLGAASAIVIAVDKLPPPLSYGALASACLESFVLTTAIYLFFALITVTPTTAPNYSKPFFLYGLKWISALLVIVATARFITLIFLAANQIEKAT